MESRDSDYLNGGSEKFRNIRTEILFTPLLVILPFVVAIFLIYDWFCRGFSQCSSIYDGELIVGVIILITNIIFDIPFIKSLIIFNRKFFKEK
jgi:hypothetical protein